MCSTKWNKMIFPTSVQWNEGRSRLIYHCSPHSGLGIKTDLDPHIDPAQEKFSSALPFQDWYRLLRTAERPPVPKLLCCELMAHTHQLPSIRGYGSSTMWQMTGDPESALQSSLWLCPASFSGRTFEFGVSRRRSPEGVTLIRENELIRVQCSSWWTGPQQPHVHCKCPTARDWVYKQVRFHVI